jgi:single-strand DNA-binding protein
MNVNKVILIGRLGKDPIISHPQQDVTKAEFTLATTESYKKDDQWHDITEWHNITAWRSVALYAERHLKKGMLVYVEGKIRSNKWQDKNGVQRTTYEIITDNIQKLEKSERSESTQLSSHSVNQAQQALANETIPDSAFLANNSPEDEVPF